MLGFKEAQVDLDFLRVFALLHHMSYRMISH